jgi:hypothetical protein
MPRRANRSTLLAVLRPVVFKRIGYGLALWLDMLLGQALHDGLGEQLMRRQPCMVVTHLVRIEGVRGSNPLSSTKKQQVKGGFSESREPALDRLTVV